MAEKKIAFTRKKLTMSGLIPVVKKAFDRVEAYRELVVKSNTISLQDCLMSALAMFSLKSPSMLNFENNGKETTIGHNLKKLFGIGRVPSDTCMRERLDEVDHGQIRRVFKDIFTCVQESKVLQEFRFMDGYYLVSSDGTGYFSSSTIHCGNCCIKRHGSCEIKFTKKDIDEVGKIRKSHAYFMVKNEGKPWMLFYKTKEDNVAIDLKDIEGLQELLNDKNNLKIARSEKEKIEKLLSKYHEVNHPEKAVEYYHQMYCGAIVHPDKKTVLPFPPEPILKSDGSEKNDCERNSSKRFYEHLRQEHPHLKIIAVEDSLAANIPHLEMLQNKNIKYITGAKPGDHKALFNTMEQLIRKKSSACKEYFITTEDKTIHHFRYVNNIQLNDSNPEFFVNFLKYTEIKKGGSPQERSWITDIEITDDNVYLIMRGGRSNWKIENETFNTLKNQKYNFEHNYGHGKKFLSSTLASLMLLAFTLDQICEAFCDMFKSAKKRVRARIYMWEDIRSIFRFFLVNTWEELYRAVGCNNLAGALVFNTS